MTSASITEARNRFSALLRSVRSGETVLITDRGRPVARLEPFRGTEASTGGGHLARLIREGIVAPPQRRLDLEAFLKAPRPRLPEGVSASDAVSRDRDEGP